MTEVLARPVHYACGGVVKPGVGGCEAGQTCDSLVEAIPSPRRSSPVPPTTSRDFQQAAAQRFTGAEALQRVRLNLDAQYLGGYTVECSLKALILHRTPAAEQLAKLIRITSSAAMHRPEVLLGELRDTGLELPVEIGMRMKRFRWSTDMRYQTGRGDVGETSAFLKTAKLIFDWVEGQL